MREHWYLAPLTLAASRLQFEIGMSRNVQSGCNFIISG